MFKRRLCLSELFGIFFPRKIVPCQRMDCVASSSQIRECIRWMLMKTIKGDTRQSAKKNRKKTKRKKTRNDFDEWFSEQCLSNKHNNAKEN